LQRTHRLAARDVLLAACVHCRHVLQVGCSEFVAVFHTAKQPSADITISFMHTGRLFICESSSERLVRMLPRVTGTWGWVHRPAVSLEHGYLSAVAAWSPIGSEQVLTAPRLRVHAGACVFRAVPCRAVRANVHMPVLHELVRACVRLRRWCTFLVECFQLKQELH
jgi:hypothetical protein